MFSIVSNQIFGFDHWVCSVTFSINDVVSFKWINSMSFNTDFANMNFIDNILLSQKSFKFFLFNLLNYLMNDCFSLVNDSFVEKFLISFLKSISSSRDSMTTSIYHNWWTLLIFILDRSIFWSLSISLLLFMNPFACKNKIK